MLVEIKSNYFLFFFSARQLRRGIPSFLYFSIRSEPMGLRGDTPISLAFSNLILSCNLIFSNSGSISSMLYLYREKVSYRSPKKYSSLGV